jgi:RNA polymerase sigma-70 factor (ECF subfamily)
VQETGETSERQLIERAREGSVTAFEQLVLSYQDRLFRFLLARSSCRADAEDALQETFVAAYRYLHSYRGKYQFSTWLFTIARRKLAYLASRRLTTGQELPELASDEPGPEQKGMAAEQQKTIWSSARAVLPEGQFSAIWLYYMEEMPVAEIATVMHRPQTWVKVNLYRARARLGKILEHPDFIESPVVTGEVAS